MLTMVELWKEVEGSVGTLVWALAPSTRWRIAGIATRKTYFLRHGPRSHLYCPGFSFWEAKSHAGPGAPIEGSSTHHHLLPWPWV